MLRSLPSSRRRAASASLGLALMVAAPTPLSAGTSETPPPPATTAPAPPPAPAPTPPPATTPGETPTVELPVSAPAPPPRPDPRSEAKAPPCPTPEPLFDAAALREALSGLPDNSAATKLARTFVIERGSDGALARVLPLSAHPGRDRALDALAEALRRSARPGDLPPGPRRCLLAAVSGPEPRVEPSEIATTSPSVADVRKLTRELEVAAHEIVAGDDALVGREFPLQYMVLIEADGSLGTARRLKSSGIAAIDAAADKAVSRTRFRPMTVEGEPVSCEVLLPLRFVFPE